MVIEKFGKGIYTIYIYILKLQEIDSALDIYHHLFHGLFSRNNKPANEK